jgi:hypothetical protein
MAKSGAAKKRDVHEYEDVTEVPISLSADELAKYSRDFAAKSIEVDAHVDEKRQFLSDWREGHEERKAEHDRLRAIVNDKSAPRRMKCRIALDFDAGEVRFYDLKSGNLLGKRPMTKEDHQLAVPGTTPEKTGGAPGSDKPPAGEKGKKLTGRTKKNDVETPRPRSAAPTPEAGGDADGEPYPPSRPAGMF